MSRFRLTSLRLTRRRQRWLLAMLSPLMEKNPLKAWSRVTPVTFSMSRCIVFAFAVGVLHLIWTSGIAGWPDVVLAMTIVLALPVVGALERSTPAATLSLVRALIDRIDIPATRAIPVEVGPTEPCKFDDHTYDGPVSVAAPAVRRTRAMRRPS